MADIGEKARSAEGHAAVGGMGGHDDRWIVIQKTTFTNWVNEQLQARELSVSDLKTDLGDGVKLGNLVEIIQSRKIGRIVKKPLNQHHYIQNVTLALNAVSEDGVKLVNIGSEDIVNGNLKLILGLIWHLILRYQIGKTKFPPKKLMLSWLQAVIPECNIRNFSSDWNDGIALSALLEYCKPGLFTNWRNLPRYEGLENCRNAMDVAKKEFGIPMVLRPEDLANPDLDDLSGMTYLSYFMMVDSPGYHATLRDTNKLVGSQLVNNFQSDWADGSVLCKIVTAAGGQVPGGDDDSVTLTQKGIDAAKRLGVEPVLKAEEMTDPEVEHLGVMAYAARLSELKPVAMNNDEKVTIKTDLKLACVGKPTKYKLEILSDDVNFSDVTTEVQGPSGKLPTEVTWNGMVGEGTFTPSEIGQHSMLVTCKGENIKDCPLTFKVFANRNSITVPEIGPCKLGSPNTITIDSRKAGQVELKVEARAPSGRIMHLSTKETNGVHVAEFVPNEIGDWQISVMYDGDHVSGSPKTIKVYDTSNVKIYGLEAGQVGEPMHFTADCTDAGTGTYRCEIYHNNKLVPVTLSEERNKVHKVHFTPEGAGLYKISCYFNENEVKGSPYTLEIVDTNAVMTTGDGLKTAAVNHTAKFTVTTHAAGGGEPTVTITAPSGKRISTKIVETGKNVFQVEYTPTEIGEHDVEVVFYGKQVYSGQTQIYNAGKVQVSGIQKHAVKGVPVDFEIDASSAGSGNLEIIVNNGVIPCKVHNLGNRKFLASFLPIDPVSHVVEMRFNGESVPGSPWVMEVIDASKVRTVGEVSQLIPVHRKAEIALNTTASGKGAFDVKVTGPNGVIVPSKLIDNRNGNYKVEYVPNEVGSHQLDILFGGQPIVGSPFLAKAYDPSAIRVTKLPDGHIGKTVEFEVDVTRAGEGQLEIMVNQGAVPNSVQMLRKGVFRVVFVPRTPADHEVDIKFNGDRVPSCPMISKVRDASHIALSGFHNAVSVRKPAGFRIKGAQYHNDLKVFITSPSYKQVPVDIVKDGDNCRIEYTLIEAGKHQMAVEYSGVSVPGSPYELMGHDISAVEVTNMPSVVMKGKEAKFIVDTSRAGTGLTEVTVNSGDHTLPTSMRQISDSRYEVGFTPSESQTHQAKVMYNGEHAPGSPYHVEVFDAEKITLHGESLTLASCHKRENFTINARGAGPGHISVNIIGPDGRDVPVHVVDSGDSTYRVDWTASLVGDYQVNVLYSGTHIPGSPFLTRACDPSKVQVSNVGPGRVGKPTTFNIDASRAGAGNLEIIVSARNENVPNFVQQEGGQARFNVSFTPQVSDTHVVSVKFNGDPVPGSPFHCAIVDGSKCSVSGDGLSRVPVNKMTWFVVDPHGTDADCIVEITAPSGRVVPARVTGSPNTGFRIEFTPTEVGRHQTKIFYADTEVKGSPFFCDAYDASKVILEQVRNGLIDTPVHMEVDASQAGEGSLEADVRSRNVQVPSEIKPKGNGMYDLSFVPRDMNTHVVNLFFNEEHARNSPWMVDIIDASHVTASGDGLRLAPVQHVAWFEVDTHGPAEAPIGVKITAPSGATVPCRVTPKPGTVNQFIGEYTPIEPGRHLVEIKYGTASIVGSPFACEAYDASRVRVTDTDYSGRVNQQLGFTVDSSLAGQGTIDAQVTAPSGRLVRLNRERLSNTLHRFTYMPEEPGDHQVEVTFNYEKIPGCPFKVFTQEVVPRTEVDMLRTSLPRESSMRDMRDGGMRETTTRRTSYFMIQPQGTQYNLRDMTCIVQAPNGNQVPAKIVQTPEGDFRAEYSSPYTGRHIVEIFFCGQPIKGSPFYVDIYDPDRVRVERLEEEAFVQKETGINIKWEDAGKAEVTIKLIGPSGQSIPFTTHNTPEGTKVNYVPTEFGTYRIHVFYGGQEISGSPFIQEVREQPLYATVQRQTIETQRSGSPYTQDVRSIAHISAYGDGLYKGEEDQPATFMVDSKGMKGDLFVQVDGPNSIAKCNIDPERDGLYAVTYVPVEVGMYNIQVKWNGMEIPGSPFHPRIVDARKVKVLGGWQSFLDSNNQVRLSVGEAKRVAFDCSEAGPGKLKAEVIGPAGRLPVEIENTSDFTKTVIFTPTVEGEYKISLWWSEVALPKSPYKGLAAGHRLPVDHTKVTMTGRGLKEAKVGHEAEFVIDGSQAGAGTPEVSMTGVKEDIHVKVKSLGGDKYRCTYTAQSAGAYLLNIQWSHRQVKGAPFKVNVSAGGDASKVVASGEGLRTGIMSKEIKSIIDTRRAGPGELTAHCMGPSRAAHVELFDHRDGTFSMSVKPQEAGKHILTVKYGGEHIQGSPYVLRVSGAPDASKVRVSGPGVSHGILARYQSRFLVDTKGAGAGQLTVRIRGPKGAFRVEMQRESQKDRTILCRYDPTEVGDYIIHVKWSGEHVPGSPFQVRICDTEEEYERYMHELRTGVALQGRPGSGGYSTLPSSHGYGTMHSNGGYWNGHPDATYATYDFRS